MQYLLHVKLQSHFISAVVVILCQIDDKHEGDFSLGTLQMKLNFTKMFHGSTLQASMCITIPNIIKIGHTFAEISQHFCSQDGGCLPS